MPLKKLGLILILCGIILPLVMLMFWGENWYPLSQTGLIYNIKNTNLIFKETTGAEPTIFDENYQKKVDEESTEKNTIEITFKYIAGIGLLLVLIGGIVVIKEI